VSLGLAVSDGERVYLAIESEGLQWQVLPSKLLELPGHPEFVLLVTGGLEHWCYVAANSSGALPSIQEGCETVMSLLDDCMTSSNQAYCLLCGHSDGQPVCYRIDRPVGAAGATCSRVCLETVQAIGCCRHAMEAKQCAEQAIGDGVAREKALREAIESRLPGVGIRGPVESRVLHPA